MGRGELLALTQADVSESAFMAAVIYEAKSCGWEVYHTHDSRRSDPGFPDLVLGRETGEDDLGIPTGEAWFVECKTNTGRLTKDQKKWLRLLALAGGQTDVWRPRDWPEILEVLK